MCVCVYQDMQEVIGSQWSQWYSGRDSGPRGGEEKEKLFNRFL